MGAAGRSPRWDTTDTPTHPRTQAPPTDHHALAPTRAASGCTKHPTHMATMVFTNVVTACKVLMGFTKSILLSVWVQTSTQVQDSLSLQVCGKNRSSRSLGSDQN